MKKVLLVCFTVCALALFGCSSQSEQAPVIEETQKLTEIEDERILDQHVEDLVAEIDALEYGPEIDDQLDSIQSAYDELPADYQDKVENYATYLEILDQYEFTMSTVDDAIAAIDAIGTIDENSMEAIDQAQAAYNAVNSEFAYLVTNADVLDGAKEACQQAISDKGVADTQALIDAGRYKDAYNYASNYISEHQFEMGSQTPMTTIMQTAELYWAYELYDQDYVGYTQQILDDLKYDAVTDGIAASANSLQSRLDNYLKTIEPANGTIIDATISGGYGEMTINSGSRPLLVKVEDAYNEWNYIYVYLRANSTTTFNVPDGTYIVKYASGDVYYGDKATKPFGEDTTYKQADDYMQFTTNYYGNTIEYSIITLTLYAVSGGNLGSTTIDGF